MPACSRWRPSVSRQKKAMKILEVLPGFQVSVGLLAALLFTLGFPDPVTAARVILSQGILRLFLCLTLYGATSVQATSLKTPVHGGGIT